MRVVIKKNNRNTLARMRGLGYAQLQNRKGGISFVRRISRTDFPRLHLYVNREDTMFFYCSLHLDQTAITYMKGNIHKGDYNSPEVIREVKRLE